MESNESAGDISSNSSRSEARQQEENEEETLPLHEDRSIYLVSFRWLKEAQDPSLLEVKRGIPYAASPARHGGPMKILNIFNSDIAFNLRKEDELSGNLETSEAGISGKDYALVPGDMWLQTLKWHSKSSLNERKGLLTVEEDMSDVFPLQLRLSVQCETNVLSAKISKKDNSVECFKRACTIFNIESEPLHIWDYSGQTMLFLSNEKDKILKESHKQTEQDVVLCNSSSSEELNTKVRYCYANIKEKLKRKSKLLLELQVYGLLESSKSKGTKKDDTGQYSNGNLSGGSINYFSTVGSNSSKLFGSSSESGILGLTGLQNLGNTCFMNSALQCLAHTPKLVDFFLGDYNREINTENPLGMNGEIASCFGDLMKKLWAPGATPVAPRTFKSKLAHFAPHFSGFNQHDSQELLAFLLDGLHEDLNRVKCKPYVELKDSDRPDEEVADEYWRNHLARNDSIIVDLFQGQFRSALVCPVCQKVSVTFDPFMYLSLPLPSTSMRTMTLSIVKADGTDKPRPFTVTVPKNGKLEDLTEALKTASPLGADETLLVAEIYNNRIIHFLEDPNDSLSLIRDDDQLVAYRLPDTKDPLFVFMHQQFEDKSINGKTNRNWRMFGVPLVVRQNITSGYEICEVYTNLLSPFLLPEEDSISSGNDSYKDANESPTEMDYASCPKLSDSPAEPDKVEPDTVFQFYLTNEKVTEKGSEIRMEELVEPIHVPEILYLLVSWSQKMVKRYDRQPLNLLPEVSKSAFFTKRPKESVPLYKCFEAFLKEEPLGPDDMWHCPVCKKHCQAGKKLDLWRLPELLVIHLKRFSYSSYLKNKLETFVDFPIHDLDLSAYIAHKDGQSSYRYMLYAISNHYGSMGGGHYTAFAHYGGDRWYDFDDSHVSPISEEKIKTSAAYVLFYRRVEDV